MTRDRNRLACGFIFYTPVAVQGEFIESTACPRRCTCTVQITLRTQTDTLFTHIVTSASIKIDAKSCSTHDLHRSASILARV